MALSFPIDPEPGDTYVAPNGYTYTWDGSKWYVVSTGQTSGGSGPFTVKDEGNVVNTATTILNFVGAAITATSTGSQVNITVTADPLTTATTATLGGVIIGSGVNITDGVISVEPGLTYWAETTNLVTTVTSLTVVGESNDIDAALEAKGTGATLGDSTGNKRGIYATDWQKQRGAVDEVASGEYSVISGGSFNRATALHSVVVGGNNHLADADYGTIVGGQAGNTRGITGAVIMPGFASSGNYDTPGAMQAGTYILSAVTNSTSPVRMSTDGNPSPTANNQLGFGDRSTVSFKGQVVAREVSTASNEIVSWTFEGVIRQDIGSFTTDFVPAGIAPTVNKIAESTATTWAFALDIDNITGCLILQATGSNTQQVRWSARVDTIEVTDAS
jgi:hypothetical protein